MVFSLKVKENSATPNSDAWLFERNFNTLDEFRAVERLCVNKSRVEFPKTLWITVRTNNCANFCKDFFFPTLIRNAMTVNDLATKLIIFPGSFILDLFTMLIRAITLIPRLIQNAAATKESHALHQYLQTNRADHRLLTNDDIYVSLSWVEGSQQRVRESTLNYIEQPVDVGPLNALSDDHDLSPTSSATSQA